jgi:hypothetical protein
VVFRYLRNGLGTQALVSANRHTTCRHPARVFGWRGSYPPQNQPGGAATRKSSAGECLLNWLNIIFKIMENQREQQDWYNRSDYRRPQDRNPYNRYSGPDYRSSNQDSPGRRHPSSDPGRQGRGPDLHGSHPYDYTLPDTGRQSPGRDYFPQARQQYRPNQYPAGPNPGAPRTRYPHDDAYREQHQGDDADTPSYAERRNYIRARDRHAYPRPADNQDGYRAEERPPYYSGNAEFSRYPNRPENQYRPAPNPWNRGPGYDRPRGSQDDRGRNWREDRPQRGFLNQAGDEIRSWFNDEDAQIRRKYDKRNGRAYRGDYPDFQ